MTPTNPNPAPRPIGSIMAPVEPRTNCAVRLAPDPFEPGRRETYAMGDRDAPRHVRPGWLYVVDTPDGPQLRRIARRGRRTLFLWTRDGRRAGTVPATTRFMRVLFVQCPVV